MDEFLFQALDDIRQLLRDIRDLLDAIERNR